MPIATSLLRSIVTKAGEEPCPTKNSRPNLSGSVRRMLHLRGNPSGTRVKVSEKGAVSVYGLGRCPVTLYKEQWLKLLDMSSDIRAFTAANEAQLKAKDR